MLDGIRVLDLSDERGQLCGMMLADLGADVICIEPPQGSHARRQGPFADGIRDAEHSLPWWSYSRNKRSAVVDLETDAGREMLREWADRADVLIESATPGWMAERGLGHADLAARNAGLVTVSITPFGQDGPKARWPATDLTVLAAGGPLWLTGDHDRAPSRVRVPQGFNHAGCEAASAALVALHERARSGHGQHVDISAQQAVTIATQSDIVAARFGPDMASRYGGGMAIGPVVLQFVYPAADGHVSITHVFGSTIGPATARMMERVCADGFCDEAMRDKDWVGYAETLGVTETIEDWEAVKAAVSAWTSSKTKAELLELAMERKLLIAPVSTSCDALESPQLQARGYFEDCERSDGKGTARVPGAWAKFSRTPLRRANPAPRLGEHTEEVCAELAKAAPVAGPSASPPTGLPLEGVKILDFMWALAGPGATRILADFGATVVRVESTTRLDVCRTMHPMVGEGPEAAALFHTVNAGKRMLTLDIAKPEARDVVLDLVRWADVVCESFAPGTMSKLGFDYQTLCETNPDLIMLSTCLMGQTGPLARFAGYGNLGAAVGGFHELAGWPDRPPAGPYGAYTDYMAPRFNAAAVLAALDHRRRTGEGQHVDVAQAEVGLHFLAPAVLNQSVNGELWSRAGNRDELYAPHGCYPVEGEDRWIAIAVDGEAPWQALCDELGAPEWASDARFADAATRRENAAALDVSISERTQSRKGRDLEAALVARGVPAHRVLDSAGLCEDPQLLYRGHFLDREAGDLKTVIEAPRANLSRTPGQAGAQVPMFGSDNQWVLGDLLGYDDEKTTDLVIAGVLE
jgi:crotonobetainyl-CoA:carnitine CoA-transferase CaiB-like acyl-CoA transferase